jgi:hypothetical protein
MLEGNQSEIAVTLWPNPDARHLVVLAHGYGEHLGRYEHAPISWGDAGRWWPVPTTSGTAGQAGNGC